ncbi:MAG: sulfatase-like hydrolase/transferase [Ferruginibacter sp.]
MKNILVIFSIAISFFCNAQTPNQKNLVIVTIDGVRWQEIFGGADSSLLFSKKYISTDSAEKVKQYWSNDALKRKEKLFPFLWKVIANQGQIYGNRKYGNYMQVKNPYWFSYPGYNEIFSGYADTLINSNDYPANPNEHFLTYINRHPIYKDKVIAFTNWSAFGRILNEEKCGFPVSYGNKPLPKYITSKSKLLEALSNMQSTMPELWETDRLDGLTYAITKEYIQVFKPKIIYLSLGETDEWAHSGKYDFYLDAAHKADAMLQDLWKTLQADNFYLNNTFLLITTDHGRGLDDKWTSHNNKTPFSNETWMAIAGPGLAATGEIKTQANISNAQLAQTMASLLNFKFNAHHPVDKKIDLQKK